MTGLLLALLMMSSRKVSDNRPLPSVRQDASECHVPADSAAYSIEFSDSLSVASAPQFTGFDKALTSNKESFFVGNPSEDLLTDFTVTIVYYNMDGRMLHSRSVTREVEIRPGERARVDIPSWDSQKQFYYYLTSPKPKRTATPFKVRFKLEKASYRR